MFQKKAKINYLKIAKSLLNLKLRKIKFNLP